MKLTKYGDSFFALQSDWITENKETKNKLICKAPANYYRYNVMSAIALTPLHILAPDYMCNCYLDVQIAFLASYLFFKNGTAILKQVDTTPE